MSSYAIVRDGPNQFRAEKGATVRLAYRGELEPGTEVSLDEVLLVADGDQVKVGTPLVQGASVKATVSGTKKGPKLIIYRYIRRKNSDKKRGHRQKFTEVVVESISG
jgi:large subunit ribosomal protein L21